MRVSNSDSVMGMIISMTVLFACIFPDVVHVDAHTHRQPPHIVVILADDMGWNDVSFHGSDQIPTPNIDALAYNGVILNSHYVPALCSPSRAALMTGKYPIHTGMQHLVILETEPWGLPLEEVLIPERLKGMGYRTHAIGKWHLGFFRKEYTPTYRGFDTHLGYYQGFQDYYDHSVKATFSPYDGYDMRRNGTVDWDAAGKYSTDLFTEEAVQIINRHDLSESLFLYLAHLAPHTGNRRDPFQAPDETIARFAHIKDPERRVYAAMVSKLDESVGDVVAALRAKGMLENSVILFMSDNGAPTFGIHSNRGSNYPLRGIKETPWEGAVRGIAALWSPLLTKRQRVSNQLMHMVDWLPTFYSLAGGDVKDLGEIDGVNMWPTLSENEPSPRTQLLHNIDDIGDVYAALRRGDWKYIKGRVHHGKADGWYGESGRLGRGQDSDQSRAYDVNAVLNSKTGSILAGFLTKQQILEKIRRQGDDGHSFTQAATTGGNERWKLLEEETIKMLRSQAEVRCGVEPVNSKGSPTGTERNRTVSGECRPEVAPCLFNIRDDPCERVNLAADRPLVLHSLEESLHRYRETMVKARNIAGDPEADPALWNGTWVSWHDEMDEMAAEEMEVTLPYFPLVTYWRREHRAALVLISTVALVGAAVIAILLLLARTFYPEAFNLSNGKPSPPGAAQLLSRQQSINVINVFRQDEDSDTGEQNDEERDGHRDESKIR